MPLATALLVLVLQAAQGTLASSSASGCAGVVSELGGPPAVCCTLGCGQSRKACAETPDVCEGSRRGDETTKQSARRALQKNALARLDEHAPAADVLLLPLTARACSFCACTFDQTAARRPSEKPTSRVLTPAASWDACSHPTLHSAPPAPS